MHHTSLFDYFVSHNWQLAVAVVVLIVGWKIAARYVDWLVVHKRYPKIVALAELFLIPLTVVVAGSLVRVLFDRLGFPEVDDEIELVAQVLMYLAIAWALAHLIEKFLSKPSDDEDGHSSLPALQLGILYAATCLVALVLFLLVNGYSITGIFVSTGAVAAIIAFAMQKTLGDLFAGIALSIEGPFKLGEWIELEDGTQGKVIDINWRATRLRGWDRATFVIPNGVLANQRFKNLHGTMHVYAPWYEVKIPADVDPRFAKALLLEAALRCTKVKKHPLPVVRLMDATSVPYTYMVWVHFPNYPAMFAGREEIYREVHYALKRAGVQIAPEIHQIQWRRADVINAEPPTTFLALRGLDIASSLTDEELEKIAAISHHVTVDSGTVLLHEGEVAPAFNVIIGGIVESRIRLANGSERCVEELSPGQYFGITSMATNKPSILEFVALTDVTLIRIDMGCLRSVVGHRPDLAEQFASVVKHRYDAAEEVRRVASNPVKRQTFQDILRSIENSIWEKTR